MVLPTTKAGQEVLRELTDLNKALKFRIGDFQALRNYRAQVKEFEALKKSTNALKSGLSTVSKTTKETRDLYKDLNKRAKELKKGVDASKNLWDRFLSKIPGGGSLLAKAGKLGSILAPLLVIILAVGVEAFMRRLQIEINESNLTNIEKLQVQLTDVNTIAVNVGLQVKGLQKREQETKIIINDIKEDILKQEVQNNFFREQFNDITYEVREGRKKLEAKISEQIRNFNEFKNDITYEVREGRKKLEAKVNEIITNANKTIESQRQQFQKQVDEAVKNANKAIDSAKNFTERIKGVEAQQKKDAQSLQSQINSVQNVSQLLGDKLEGIQKQIREQGFLSRDIEARINRELDIKLKTADANTAKQINAFKTELNNRITKAEFERDVIKNQIQSLLLDKNKTAQLEQKFIELEQANKRSQNILNEFKTQIATAKQQQAIVDASQDTRINTLANTVNAVVKKQGEDFTVVTKINGRVAAIDKYSQDTRLLITRVNDEIVSIKQNINGRLEEIDKATFEKLKPEIQRETKTQISTIIQPQINQLKQADKNLDNKLKTIDVEAQEIEKQIEKTIKPDIDVLKTKIKEREDVDKEANIKLGQILGLIPGIPARTAGFITPNIPSKADIQQATGTAICNSVNGGCLSKGLDGTANKINNNLANLLSGLGLGADGLIMGMLNTINSKLGAQLPGGIAGKLVGGFKWLVLDRALNLMILAVTIQNHLMLSNDIAQTLIGAINNVITLIGIKDDNDQPFDVGKVINSSVESFIKGIVGSENYTVLSERWAKAVRVYQAATNVLNTFQGLTSTVLNALEITAGRVGKIGNALKKSGEVLENAYSWMNPQPKFNRVTNFLENLQNGASTVQMITQAPLDVINATTELTNANTEFVKALKEDGKPENKGNEDQEPEQLKAKELKAKTASIASSISPEDFFNASN